MLMVQTLVALGIRTQKKPLNNGDETGSIESTGLSEASTVLSQQIPSKSSVGFGCYFYTCEVLQSFTCKKQKT